MKKNIIFFGSPEFSATILESIIKSGLVNGVACPPAYAVCGVVTTPDKPQGRKQILTSSLVATLASSYNLPVYKPEKLDEQNLAHLKLLKPDIFLVVSYGKIIPKTYLETPKIGTFNVHFSLLPKYRGALCINEAIKNQDKTTGVTLMKMDELLDHGPIISQVEIPIDIDDDTATLTTKLTQTTITLLADKLPEICAQNYQKTAQDETKVVFTPSYKTLTRQSAYIPYEKLLDGPEIHALIRSLNPTPGAWTIIPLSPPSCHSGPDPESIQIKIIKTSLIDNKLVLNTVQLPGKSPISWKQFRTGHHV